MAFSLPPFLPLVSLIPSPFLPPSSIKLIPSLHPPTLPPASVDILLYRRGEEREGREESLSHVSHLSTNISPLAVVDRGSVSSASDTPYSPGSDVPDTPTLSSSQFGRLCKCVTYTSRNCSNHWTTGFWEDINHNCLYFAALQNLSLVQCWRHTKTMVPCSSYFIYGNIITHIAYHMQPRECNAILFPTFNTHAWY